METWVPMASALAQGEICPSAEAWLNIYETRLRATRPKASVEAQWIGDQSRWSLARMMQNGHNEVQWGHVPRRRAVGALGSVAGIGFGRFGCQIMDRFPGIFDI